MTEAPSLSQSQHRNVGIQRGVKGRRGAAAMAARAAAGKATATAMAARAEMAAAWAACAPYATTAACALTSCAPIHRSKYFYYKH